MYKLSFLIFFLLVSCSGDSSVPTALLHDPTFYFGSSKTVTLNVYYEEGAEPYVGDFSGANPVLQKRWDLTYLNLEEIFSFKSQSTQIDVPRELNQMTPLGHLEDQSWEIDDILDLAIDQDINSREGDEAIFSVFFVNGYFESEGEIKTNIIGVNLSGTSITVIFKDVIKAMPQSVRIFSEQATVIHEVGHALGLVNNGVPAVADHFTGENGAHSNDDGCIMYHLNEGASDLIQFIIDFNTSGDATLWGPGVLEDVEAFSR